METCSVLQTRREDTAVICYHAAGGGVMGLLQDCDLGCECSILLIINFRLSMDNNDEVARINHLINTIILHNPDNLNIFAFLQC